MRWVSVTSGAGTRAGLFQDGMVHVLTEPGGVLGLLGDDGEQLAAAAERAVTDPYAVVPFAEARVQSPIPTPPSIRDFMGFEEHVITAMQRVGRGVDPVWYDVPVFYFSNPASVHGPFDDVRVSPGCSQFDFEVEVAAIVGRPGRNLSPEAAQDRIAGYLVMCDWSARDIQMRDSRLRIGPGKGKDGATSLGPFLVTRDEIEFRRDGNGYDLSMTAAVNGRRYTTGNWSSIHWSLPEMIAYASRGCDVVSGDVIGSGTVGRGSIYELSFLNDTETYPYLSPGDFVEIEIEQLGGIACRIGTADPVVPLRPAQPDHPTHRAEAANGE